MKCISFHYPVYNNLKIAYYFCIIFQATVALLSDPANKLEISEALKYKKEIHSQNSKKKKNGSEEETDVHINSGNEIVNGGRIIFMSSNNFQTM